MLDHARSGGLRAGYARPIGGSFRAELDTQKIALGGLCVTDFANANLAATITFYRFCCCRAPNACNLRSVTARSEAHPPDNLIYFVPPLYVQLSAAARKRTSNSAVTHP
jgi:hypothetical protein